MIQRLKNHSRKILMMACLTAISFTGRPQTMPNLYPVQWLHKKLQQACTPQQLVADTSIKPRRKCITWDSCNHRHRGGTIFVNHDSLIRKRVLKTWRY